VGAVDEYGARTGLPRLAVAGRELVSVAATPGTTGPPWRTSVSSSRFDTCRDSVGRRSTRCPGSERVNASGWDGLLGGWPWAPRGGWQSSPGGGRRRALPSGANHSASAVIPPRSALAESLLCPSRWTRTGGVPETSPPAAVAAGLVWPGLVRPSSVEPDDSSCRHLRGSACFSQARLIVLMVRPGPAGCDPSVAETTIPGPPISAAASHGHGETCLHRRPGCRSGGRPLGGSALPHPKRRQVGHRRGAPRRGTVATRPAPEICHRCSCFSRARKPCAGCRGRDSVFRGSHRGVGRHARPVRGRDGRGADLRQLVSPRRTASRAPAPP